MIKYPLFLIFAFPCWGLGSVAAASPAAATPTSASLEQGDHLSTGTARSTATAGRAKSAARKSVKWVPPGVVPCSDIPAAPLSDADLARLVPERSPGVVRVKWVTESQDETYGFNILRSDRAEGPYYPINSSIIPGEGNSNIPRIYCYEDRSVKRGECYYYQIQEVSNNGQKSVVDGTEGTRVRVKTVDEERAWFRKQSKLPEEARVIQNQNGRAPSQ